MGGCGGGRRLRDRSPRRPLLSCYHFGPNVTPNWKRAACHQPAIDIAVLWEAHFRRLSKRTVSLAAPAVFNRTASVPVFLPARGSEGRNGQSQRSVHSVSAPSKANAHGKQDRGTSVSRSCRRGTRIVWPTRKMK